MTNVRWHLLNLHLFELQLNFGEHLADLLQNVHRRQTLSIILDSKRLG